MGRTRSSAFVFAAAYIVLVVGLFLALGGAAYAPSSACSAGDQYGDKVKGVKVSATAGGDTARPQPTTRFRIPVCRSSASSSSAVASSPVGSC